MNVTLTAPDPPAATPEVSLNRHYPVSFGPCDFDIGRVIYHQRRLVIACTSLRTFARTVNRGGTPRSCHPVREYVDRIDASDWPAPNVFNHPSYVWRRALRRRAAKTFSAPLNLNSRSFS